MASLRSRKLALTLLCTLALALALLAPAQAADPLALNHRDHAQLNRMIKKRAPSLLDDLGAVHNAGDDDTGSSSSTSAGSATATLSKPSSTPAASSTASSVAASTPSASNTESSTASVTSSTASSSASSTSSTASSTASSTTSSSVASSTTSSSSSAPPPSSTTPAPAAASNPPPSQQSPVVLITSDAGGQAVTITSHVPAATPTVTPAPKSAASDNSSSLSKGAITTLGVIAGCVGGGALIWTIFRKWKLRASKRFDERLAPIDWQPSADGDDIPGSNRRASIASSFHSAGHDGLGRANSTGSSSQHGYNAYGSTNQHAPSLQPLPEHDFTATANMGYLGSNAGYADLARGPSPGPQMQDLSRGPSFNNGYNTGAYQQQGGYQQQQGAYGYNTSHY